MAEKKKIRAGEAYVNASKQTPEGRAAMNEAQARLRTASGLLQCLSEAMRQDLQALKDKHDAEMARAVDQLHIDAAQYASAWEQEYGEPYPADVDEWAKLAVRAGIDANRILDGHWIPTDIGPVVEGYLQRQRDKQSVTRSTSSTGQRMDGEARALAVLAKHPDWNNAQIAAEAEVHVKSLSRWQRFKAARAVQQAAKGERSTAKYDRRTGDMQAEASTKCRHCDDTVQPWTCSQCDTRITNACRECHAEVTHG